VRLKQKRANLSLGESTLFYKVSPFLGRKSKDHDIHAQVGLERERLQVELDEKGL
jgi:hypothetical protein